LVIDVLNEQQKEILPKLADALTGTDLYLAGGTALALQVGHRPSIDFDWFGDKIGDPEILFRRLRGANLDFIILTSTFETLYLEVETVQVSFIGYSYPMLNPLCQLDEYGIQMAGLDDIACMKLSAVTNRGARKDFIDLHYLVSHHRPLEEYLQLFQKKFQQQDVGHVIRSLAYFEDADQEPEISMFTDIPWIHMKNDFELWVKAVG